MSDLHNLIVYGYLHVKEDTIFDGAVTLNGAVTLEKLILTALDYGFDPGGAPIEVQSKGRILNLNADYLDDQHGAYYLDLANSTGYIGNDNFHDGSITLEKIVEIQNLTLLGRIDNSTVPPILGPVTELGREQIQPILHLARTNRGDQAVFSNINVFENNIYTELAKAVEPLDYEDVLFLYPNASLIDIIDNKDTLTFVPGEYVYLSKNSGIENGININVGIKLTDGILKGSTNNNSPVAIYTPHSVKQNYMSFDIGNDCPDLYDRLNLSAALYATRMYVSDLKISSSAGFESDNNRFSEVLTTKKTETEINQDFKLAFFDNKSYSSDFNLNVGYNIVRSYISLDDSIYSNSNILTAKKIKDDLENFKINNIDNRLIVGIANLNGLLTLNANALADGVLVIVRSEGIYRLSKFETIYTEDDGKNVISVPNLSDGKWIKICSLTSYHNDTDAIQGGDNLLKEYYHVSASQHAELHAPNSDNQIISSGDGMDFVSSDKNVVISLGRPKTVSASTYNELTSTRHSHTIESYDLEAVAPVILTDGVKVLGTKGIIRITPASTGEVGVVRLSNDINGTAENVAVTELALHDAIAAMGQFDRPSNTIIGNIPTWGNITGSELTTGFGVISTYSDYNLASQTVLESSMIRADTIKTIINNTVAAVGNMAYKGAIDCSTNPNYPAAILGDVYIVSGTGKIGGASGVSVNIGDLLICHTASGAGNQSAVGSFWDIIPAGNISGDVINPSEISISNNFAMFTGTDGSVIHDSGYSAASFQPISAKLTSISSISNNGFLFLNGNIASTLSISTSVNSGIEILNTSTAVTINHADTSSQASISTSPLTWLSAVTLDDYGHVVSLATTSHPSHSSSNINIANEGLTTDINSGITVLSSINCVVDNYGHVSTATATKSYLPVATALQIGVLTPYDYNVFKNKLDGNVSGIQVGSIPTWADDKTLTIGYMVESDELDSTTIAENVLPSTKLLSTLLEGNVTCKGYKVISPSGELYPEAKANSFYIINGTGKIGDNNLYDGDIIYAIEDAPANTPAKWKIYRKRPVKYKKVIIPTTIGTALTINDIYNGSTDFSVEIYRNGIWQLQSDAYNTYDFSINNLSITLSENTIIGEKIVIIVTEY